MSLLMRLLTQPEPPHRLLAPNPRIGLLIFNRIMALGMIVFFLCIFGLVGTIELLMGGFYNKVAIGPWTGGALFVLSNALNIFFCSVQLRYCRQLELRRFAAISGGKPMLAREQPEPIAYFLNMPVSIKISQLIGGKFFLRYVTLLFLLIIIWAYIVFTLFLGLLWYLVIPIIIGIGALIIFLVALVGRTRLKVEIKQDGLRFKSSGTTPVFLPWKDARLFACYPEPGLEKDGPTVVYELASASHVLQWRYVRRRTIVSWLCGHSEAENVQARALCSLVVERTGLPLYDLSQQRD